MDRGGDPLVLYGPCQGASNPVSSDKVTRKETARISVFFIGNIHIPCYNSHNFPRGSTHWGKEKANPLD